MNNNIWQYILYFFILFYIINSSEVENKVIISCIISFGVIYLYYTYDNNTILKNKQETTNNVFSNKPNDYRFVSNDESIIDLMKSLKHIKKYNKLAYNEALKHLDNFLRLKDDISHGIGYPKQNCEVAIEERKKALNALSSLIVNCPNYQNDIFENQIINTIKKLENLTYNYLYENARVLNQDWEDGKVDITSGEIILNAPKGVDSAMNKNYDLYN